MAVTIVSPAKNGSRVMGKILQRLARGSSQTTEVNKKSNLSLNRLKRRAWVSVDADPAVALLSAAVAPVQVGDFAYRVDTDEAFICSVAPSAAHTGVFIQLHVDP